MGTHSHVRDFQKLSLDDSGSTRSGQSKSHRSATHTNSDRHSDSRSRSLRQQQSEPQPEDTASSSFAEVYEHSTEDGPSRSRSSPSPVWQRDPKSGNLINPPHCLPAPTTTTSDIVVREGSSSENCTPSETVRKMKVRMEEVQMETGRKPNKPPRREEAEADVQKN